MSWFRRAIRSVWGRDRLSAEVREEMDFHISERTRDLIAHGVEPAEAARIARASFGSPTQLSERTRDMDVIEWLDATARESGQALRGLRRRPGLVVTAILSLGLGIGATSAIFSVVDAVLLKPLPIPDADAVVFVREARNGEVIGGNVMRLRDYREQSTSFQSLAGFYGESATMPGADGPQRFAVVRSFGPVLSLLQANPQQGRGFTKDEEDGIGAPVAVLTHATWQRRFGGDATIVGRTLTLEGIGVTIIGVLPSTFQYPADVDLLIPAGLDLQRAGRRGNYFTIVGRLNEGVTLAAAQTEVQGLAQRFGSQYPDTDKGLSATLIGVQESETADARGPLLLLLGAVAVVLLVACVNIASLLLARAAERGHEAAVRVALGAGRSSLLRLYLMESGWLALAGGTVGLGLAWVGVPILRRILPGGLPRLAEATLDWRVALFTLATAVGCGLLFGLIPAWQASRATGTASALRDGGRSTTSGGRLLIRRGLVVLQVTLSMMLLVAAGLLGESLYRMRHTPSGVMAQQVLTVRIGFSWDTDGERLHRFYRQAIEELGVLPGVVSVGLTDRLPLEGESQSRTLRLQDEAAPGVAALTDKNLSFRLVSRDYFSTVGVPLRSGRVWQESSAEARPRELVVNETFARRYLAAGRPAEGTRLTFDVKPEGGRAPVWYEIVGVVGDIRQTLSQPEQPPEVFLPYGDGYWPLAVLVLRTQGDPAAVIPRIRSVIGRIAPDQVIDRIGPLTGDLAEVSRESQVRTWLVGAFASVALLLAAIGLFGVLSSDVSQRRQEIGVRLALGAEAGQVRWMMIRHGLVVALIGLAAGTAGALALGQVLASTLYGVTPRDASAFLGAGVVLFLVALVASYLPARAASTIDPVTALRRE